MAGTLKVNFDELRNTGKNILSQNSDNLFKCPTYNDPHFKPNGTSCVIVGNLRICGLTLQRFVSCSCSSQTQILW